MGLFVVKISIAIVCAFAVARYEYLKYHKKR